MADFLKKDFKSIVNSLLGDLSSGQGGRVALTDTTEGSVVRTLVEAFARELAVTYAQLDQVYQLGYLDTARGPALDNVVALLGVTRRRGGDLQGTVAFSRATAAPADIFIPAGTQVSGKGLPAFETLSDTTIPRGSTQTVVAVRSLAPPAEDLDPEALEPGALNEMVRPLEGIDAVSNPVRLVPPQQDETDDELRARARREVAASNVGTPAALEYALRRLGLTHVEVQERPDEAGVVDVVVGDPDFNDDLREQARRAIEEARPAGVRVNLQGVSRVWVAVTATLELNQAYAAPERAAIEAELRQAVQDYVEGLGVNTDVREAKLRSILAGHPKVLDVFPKVSEPRTADQMLLTAWLEVNGVAQDVTPKRRLPSGDIQPRATERAGMKPLQDAAGNPVLPLQLTLEPPAPQVFVDVELQLSKPVADAEELLRSSSSMREYLAALPSAADPTLKLADLIAALPVQIKTAYSSARFTVSHERDGRVVRLDDELDRDAVLPRERPKLRAVVVLGGTP